MELRTLRYFLAAAQEENLTKAADILHVTQPTLSRQLADLEKELGTTLMIRGKKGITLTDDGIFFKQRAQELVELADRLESNFVIRKNDIGGMVVIVAAETTGSQTLAKLVKRFSDKYPAVRFTLYNETVDNIKDRLDKGLVDIGLLLEPVDTTKYDYIRLPAKDKWGLLVPANHPLAGKNVLHAEEITSYPLLLPLRENVRAETMHWLNKDEKDLKIPLFYSLLSNAVLMVTEGLGLAICMDGALALKNNPHLKFIPLKPEKITHSVLIWKKNNLFSPATSLFIQEINTFKSEL